MSGNVSENIKLFTFTTVGITKKGELKIPLICNINWDGIPIFKSSSKSLSLICEAVSNSRLPLFPLGMFVGPSKPKEPEDFFSEFINQLDDLVTNGTMSFMVKRK